MAICVVVVAQVPSATDPAKYVLPPKTIVDVFDAEPLPQVLISPNRQVVALTKARTYPTIVEIYERETQGNFQYGRPTANGFSRQAYTSMTRSNAG